MNDIFNSSMPIGIYESEKDRFKIEFDRISFCVSRNGGRIISLKYGAQELLTQPNEHEMHGSTFWHDPQSSWNWPPPPVLDNMPYDGGIIERSIHLISAFDNDNGLQFEKIFSVNDDRSIKICYHIKNISIVPKSVGPWEITRVPSGGVSFFVQGENAVLPASDLNNITTEKGIVWYQPDNVQFPGGKKYFSTVGEGWLAHVSKNILFVKKFRHIDAKQIAPGQGELEIYAHGDKSYIELENHGEHQNLLPGKSLVYNVQWYLKDLPLDTDHYLQKEKLVDEVRFLIK